MISTITFSFLHGFTMGLTDFLERARVRREQGEARGRLRRAWDKQRWGQGRWWAAVPSVGPVVVMGLTVLAWMAWFAGHPVWAWGLIGALVGSVVLNGLLQLGTEEAFEAYVGQTDPDLVRPVSAGWRTALSLVMQFAVLIPMGGFLIRFSAMDIAVYDAHDTFDAYAAVSTLSPSCAQGAEERAHWRWTWQAQRDAAMGADLSQHDITPRIMMTSSANFLPILLTRSTLAKGAADGCFDGDEAAFVQAVHDLDDARAKNLQDTQRWAEHLNSAFPQTMGWVWARMFDMPMNSISADHLNREQLFVGLCTGMGVDPKVCPAHPTNAQWVKLLADTRAQHTTTSADR